MATNTSLAIKGFQFCYKIDGEGADEAKYQTSLNVTYDDYSPIQLLKESASSSVSDMCMFIVDKFDANHEEYQTLCHLNSTITFENDLPHRYKLTRALIVREYS